MKGCSQLHFTKMDLYLLTLSSCPRCSNNGQCYPVESAIGFPNTYLMDRGFSCGYSTIECLNNQQGLNFMKLFYRIKKILNLAGKGRK